MRLCIVAGLIPSSNEIVQMHLYTPHQLDNGRVNKRSRIATNQISKDIWTSLTDEA